MNKTGVSPLIATVLIIGFTIALAAVVMIWGDVLIKNNIEQVNWLSLKELKCLNEVNFKITQESCFNESLLSLNIYNIGKSAITKIYVKKQGIGIPANTGEIRLKPFYEEKYNFTISCNETKEFEIYPVITFNKIEGICQGSVKKLVLSS